VCVCVCVCVCACVCVVCSTRNMVSVLDNPKTRFSFVTFDSAATVVLPLTSDRVAVHNGLIQLAAITAGGSTDIGAGLKAANDELQRRYLTSTSIPIYFVMTDGQVRPTALCTAIRRCNEHWLCGV
jgi:Mg-chelatase subunit ChlD